MLVLISAWIWGYVLSRFSIWPHRCEGMIWLPYPNASSWYRLTNLRGAIQYTYLTPVFVYQNLVRGLLLLLIPRDDILISAIIGIHVYSNIWWPAFMELKLEFKYCVAICFFNLCAIIFVGWQVPVKFFILVILDGLVILWAFWISLYAHFIVKTPTTHVEYQRRQSRV